MTKNVLLNAFDSASHAGPFPNLAIMKLAAHHKNKGDNVGLTGAGISPVDSMPDPDLVYVSCIFDWNGAQARGLRWMYPKSEFRVGGSGIDLVTKLPPEIENILPDEEIYNNRGVPGWPYALGFSSRGCNRKCPFCIVPRKEGRIELQFDLDQLVGHHKKLLLLDNNLTQDPKVEEKLQWLADWGGKVNYSQGLDARVIERKPHLADLLVETDYRGRNFKSKVVTLAYDHPAYRKIIERCCKILKEAGFNLRQHVQFFVLTNFNTTFEEDLQRVNHLRSMGTAPYLMIYDKKKAPLKIRRLQRWCNNRVLYWGHEWKDYSRRPLEKNEMLAEIQVGDF